MTTNRNIIFALSAVCLLIFLHATQNKSGPPAGYTEAPGENSCTACHGGTTNLGPGNASVDVGGGLTAYTPGQTYTVTVTASETGRSTFGFQAAVKQQNGNDAGTLAVTNSTETKLADPTHIEHTISGTSGSNSKSWSFNWTAPPATTGTCTLYVTCNAANGNSSSSGDNIYATVSTLTETVSCGNIPNAQSISTTSNNICSGNTATLSVPLQADIKYQWKRGSTNVGTNSNTYNASTSGNYTVVMTDLCDANSKISTNSVTIAVAPTPTVHSITSTRSTVCASAASTLSVPLEANVNYQWKKNGTNIGTNSNLLSANTAGTYSVTMTDSCGINPTDASNTIVLTLEGGPGIQSITAAAVTVTPGDSVMLSVPAEAGVSYQWMRNNIAIGTDTNVYFANMPGTYSLTISDSCGSIPASNSVTLDATARGKQLSSFAMLKVYPIPSKGLYTIEWQSNKNTQSAVIKIYNLEGKVLLKRTISQPMEQIDLRALSSGSYILSIQTDHEVQTMRLIQN